MAIISSRTGNNAVAYVNGRVYTVNPDQPWVSAFIVSPEGKFSATGSTEEITAEAMQEGLVIYDLRDHFVMPGIHDAHTHLLSASMQQLNESSIGFDSTPEDISERIKKGVCACSYAHVWGDWIIANFYSYEKFPDGKADRKYLDDMFPDKPVIVRDPTCHNIFMNTAGLKRAGYDLEEKNNPEGGWYVRREDGEMTGELVESASRRAWLAVPKPALAHVKRSLKYAFQMCHRFGITSCQEASANTIYLQALQELESEGALTLDIHTHIVSAPENFAQEERQSLHDLIDISDTFKSERIITRFTKTWMDGAPFKPHYTQCDLDEHGQPDESKILVDWKTLSESVKKYDSRGLTCKIHVAGEGSARRALDAIEYARKHNPGGPRHELAHCNAIHEDDVPRLAKLNVTAEFSPAMFHDKELIESLPHLFKWPIHGLMANGTHMTFGSDWFLPLTPNLFPSLAAIVETMGTGPGAEHHPGETVRERGGAILTRAITMGGAQAVARETEIGSIEVGKKANFIALNRDLSKGEFDGVEVLRTWYEGKMVWNTDTAGSATLVA